MVLLWNRSIIVGRNVAVGRLSTSSFCVQSRTLRFRHDVRTVQCVTVCGIHKPTHLRNVTCDIKLNVNWSQVLRIHTAAAGLSQDGSKQFSTTSSLNSPNQAVDGPLVYKGDINMIVKGLKMLSMTTSLFGCVIVPLTLFYHNDSMVYVMTAALAGLTIFTPFLLHWVTKGYVSHMYFNRETDMYTACTYSIFLRTKKLQFTPNDVTVPAVRNIFTSFVAKGVPLLVDDSKFFNPNDVLHLKGYDKMPENLTLEQLKKIYQSEEESDKKE